MDAACQRRTSSRGGFSPARCLRGRRTQSCGPRHILARVCGNIAWKAVRQGRLPRSDAESAIQVLLNRNIATISSADLLPEALALAFNFGRSVYDSLYVSLAAHTKNEFITADEKLANAMAAQVPIKWLGASEPHSLSRSPSTVRAADSSKIIRRSISIAFFARCLGMSQAIKTGGNNSSIRNGSRSATASNSGVAPA